MHRSPLDSEAAHAPPARHECGDGVRPDDRPAAGTDAGRRVRRSPGCGAMVARTARRTLASARPGPGAGRAVRPAPTGCGLDPPAAVDPGAAFLATAATLVGHDVITLPAALDEAIWSVGVTLALGVSDAATLGRSSTWSVAVRAALRPCRVRSGVRRVCRYRRCGRRRSRAGPTAHGVRAVGATPADCQASLPAVWGTGTRHAGPGRSMMRLTRRRPTGWFAVASVLAVLAGLLTMRAAAAHTPMDTVLVAASQPECGHPARSSRHSGHPGAVPAAGVLPGMRRSFDEIQGRTLAVPVAAGEPLTDAALGGAPGVGPEPLRMASGRCRCRWRRPAPRRR